MEFLELRSLPPFPFSRTLIAAFWAENLVDTKSTLSCYYVGTVPGNLPHSTQDISDIRQIWHFRVYTLSIVHLALF